MSTLEGLRPDHAAAVLAFEMANRAYFARSVSDRGDAFFDQFADRFAAVLAEQSDGVCAFYVLVDDDGSVIGRFNLYDLEDGRADLGYRVAEAVAGRGVATESVRQLCRIAAVEHGLHTLRAATSSDNGASRAVLTKAGFTVAGPAEPAELGGRSGHWYQRELAEDAKPVLSPHDVARVWAEVLGLPEVDLDTDFYDLGGHSLLLMELVSRLHQQLGVQTDVLVLLEHSTVAEFTGHWNSTESARTTSR